MESNTYYLEKAPIKKAIAKLSIPMMIGLSVGTIYNIINSYFIGMLHSTAMLGAIALGTPIFIVLMAIGNMFGVGGGTFITRLIANNEKEKAKNIAGYVFYGSIILGLIIGIAVQFFMTPLMSLLGATGQTFIYTKHYATVLFLGGFALILNFALEQIVRAEGATKNSMYGSFVSTGVSLVLDVLLILVFKLHIYGAALSMVIANICAVAYYVFYIQTKSENLKGFLKIPKISLKDKFEIYKIGSSELIQMGFVLVTTLLVNYFSMQYGDDVIASFGIALRITQFPEFLSMGLVLGVMPLIAYNFANKNIVRLKAAIRNSAIYIGCISISLTLIAYIFRNDVMHFFSNSQAVITIGAYIIVVMLVSSIFNGFTGLLMTIFQAAGEGAPTMILSITQGVLYIPVLLILHYFFGLHGLIWSTTVTEVIAFIIAMVLFIGYRKKINKINKM